MRSNATYRSVRGVDSSAGTRERTTGAVVSSAQKNRPVQNSRVDLLARLDPQIIEQLETRLHLSVSRDTNGYTIVTPEAGATVIYVANSGSDSNPGTINAPVASIKQALALVHPQSPGGQGFGDQILLRRGDTFNIWDNASNKSQLSGWYYSGKDANNPFVLGAYTDPNRASADRPKINSGFGTAFSNLATTNNHPALSNVDILGVSFEASDRNYRQPNANFTVGTKSDALGGTYGFFLLGNIKNMLIEDTSVQYYRTGLSIQEVSGWGRPTNITLRRNVIVDQYVVSFDSAGHYVTSEGIYAQGNDNLTLEENVFDHNGWMDPAYGDFGAVPSLYNHNAYLNDMSNNVVVTGNIFANASSHGIQMRSGGYATNNLFINNPIAMSFGYENEHERPGGVFGEISGNIIYGGRDISGAPRGWGLEIGNLMPKANGGSGTVVRNNIYAGYTTQGQPALQLSIPVNPTNPETAVGINDLTLSNNIVYGWTKGVYINPGFAMGGTGRFAFNNVSILNNEFQQVNATPIISHGPAYTPSVETWRGNRYSLIGGGGGSTPYFQTKINGTLTNQTLSQWQATVEPTASTPSITYPDPNRNPGTYNGLKGGTATVDGFLAEARQMSSKFYRTAYTAVAVDDYMKAGFAGQRVDSLSPTGQLSPLTVSVAGGTSTTFTVTWTDDNQVNLSSIDSNDIQVSGPGGYSQAASLVSATPNADGSVVTAVYSIPAPNGSWSAAANGSYVVNVKAGQLQDNSGNAATAGVVGGFLVNISAAAPSATLAPVADVTNPKNPATMTVTYSASSDVIDISTLDDSDLLISGPNGFFSTARFVSVQPASNGSPRVATYALDAPGGSWTSDANGTYTVSVQAGEVRTTVGTGIGSATLGTFKVNVSVPTATATGPTITAATSANQTITVKYTDASGILSSSIDANDIQVDGPGYYADANSGLTLVSKSGAGTPANPLIAVYSIPAPSGGFGETNNGTFHINVVDGQVISSNFSPIAAAVVGTFTINIDQSGPLAVLAQADVFKPTSASTKAIVINYSDPSGVKTSALGTGDITVTYSVTGQVFTPTFQGFTGSGNQIAATYLLSTPGGLSAANNGYYDVVVQDSAVQDNKGNQIQSTWAGAFRVAIDSEPPQATASASDIYDPTQDQEIFVSYADDPGVDVNTLDDFDIRVVGPKGFNQPVTLQNVDAPSGSNANVIYKLLAPTGGWLVSQNGTYSIVLQPNAVSDLTGNATPSSTIGSFMVNLPTDVIATFGAIPDNNGPGLNQVTFRFNQKVSGLSLNNISLDNGGAPVSLAGKSLTTTDNMNYTLSGLSSSLTTSGTYTITIHANQNIVGEFGSSMTSDQSVSFNVDADAPTLSFYSPGVIDAGTGRATFQITWYDNTGTNANTLGNGDLIVTGPAGTNYSQVATLDSLDDNSIGQPRTATYSVPAPAGGWSASYNGLYDVRVQSNQVSDVLGNTVAPQLAGQFAVAISGTGTDITGPTARMTDVTSTSANGLPIQFNVIYTDDTGVDLSTLGDTDIVVKNDAVAYNLKAKLVTIGSQSGGAVVVTYAAPAPTGGWTSAYNGTYSVLVRANEVYDTLGNVYTADPFIGRLNVNISSSTPDTTPPTASFSPITPNPRSTPLDSATIVFSEPVTGFDLSDLTIAQAGATSSGMGPSQTLTTSDNKTWTLSGLSAVTATPGTYTITLKSAGTNIVDLQNNPLTTGASASWTYSSTPVAPVVSSVSPSPVIGSTSKQNLTINGSGFSSTATVKLKNITTGTTTTATIVSRSATQIVVSNVFGSSASSWSAEVLNGTLSSGKISFGVIPSGALGISVTSGLISGKTATLAAVNPGTSTSTIFTWSATTLPSGASAPTFSANKTNSAKNTTITFKKAGDYTLKLTAVTGSTTKTYSLVVTVNQSLTSIAVSPATATVRWKQTQTITASAKDQFGSSMTTQPAFTWSLDAGGVGTVSSTGVYTAPVSGSGTAKVRATTGLLSATATITVPSFTSSKVNFEPSGAATVSGYIVDSGATFAARNSQQYGWSTSETAQVFDRAKNSNQLLDTSLGILSGAKWEMAVPNGTYSVKVSVGDASKKTTNTIRVEGTTAFSATVLNANAFSNKTVSVTVADGRLTIDAGSAASGTTWINYVEITKTA